MWQLPRQTQFHGNEAKVIIDNWIVHQELGRPHVQSFSPT